MSIRVDGVDVPVIWRPVDLTGPDSDGHAGRLGHPIRAIVHHRIVGSLESMTNNTFAPTTDDVLRDGERRVSSHFGIGFWTLPDGRQELRIVQYVALQDTAYTNGQSAADRDACSWALWLDAGRPPANEISVTIEHEDNGKAGDYVVKEPIIRASIALDRLLLSGDAVRIRAAGIHCSDGAAAQLGRMTPTKQTLVDHHVVCPVSKPFCWRPIGADAGFPQSRYVSELTTEEDPNMPTLTAYIPGQVATVKPTANVRPAPRLDAPKLRVVDTAETWVVTGWVRGDVDPEGGSDQWVCRWAAGRWEYTAKSNLSAGPAPAPDPTNRTDADVTNAAKAAALAVKTAADQAAAKYGA